MSDKRQKNQLVLAFTEEGRSEAPKASQEGTESLTAKCETERPASHEPLMEEVCERENCWQAYKRVKANKGSPGIDGMKVGELSGYLKQHWPSIREQLLRGTYQPQPDQWIRHRLRSMIWKQWKRGTTRYAKLRHLGVGKDLAAQTARSPLGPWRLASSTALQYALPIAYVDALSLPRLFDDLA